MGGGGELEERGTFKSHEQRGRFEVRDPLLAAVNGELHTLLTAVCAAARRRRKSGEKESQEGERRRDGGRKREREGEGGRREKKACS